MDFKFLEFKFADVPPWNFPPVRICLFLSKLVIASHSPSKLRCSASEHAQVHATYVAIYTDGSKSSKGVGCAAVFPDFDVFLSLPRISFPDIDSFVIYSDSRSALQVLGSLYTPNPLVLKIRRFLCDFHTCRNFVSCWIPSHVWLFGNEKADVLAKRAIKLPSTNLNALPLQDYIPSIRRFIRASWQYC